MRSLAPSSYELSSLFLSPPLSAPKISQTLYFLCSFPIPNPSLRLCHRRSPAFAFAFSSKNPQRQDLLSPSDPSEDEDEDDDDDDEDEAAVAAAEEYDEALVEVSEEEEEEFGVELSSSRSEVKEGNKLQRIERVFALVKELGDDILDFDEIASVYDFPVDKFQRLAIQSFLRGSSVVVSAPTSSGKTLIAEAAAVATIARGRRLFYTTPLKALSNQKFREFRFNQEDQLIIVYFGRPYRLRVTTNLLRTENKLSFGENNVGLLTGDSSINKDAQILIMTTEILRNMLYQSVGMSSSGSKLFHVDVIVLDEVHYLSDISRGTVWEEIVIYCPKEVQLICLSATVANPDELAGWIGKIHGKTELVISNKRPVPLTWHFSMKNSMVRLLDEKGKKMNRKLSLNYMQSSMSRPEAYSESNKRKYRTGKPDYGIKASSISRQASLSKGEINSLRRSQVPQIRDTLRHLNAKNMLPAIWFIFSRRGCDAAVQYVEDSKLLDECEAGEVELRLRKFRMQYPDAVREVAVKGLLHGIAAHHAGCLPLWKSFVEELFQLGLVKVVFATETLAAGINMPARTSVIASLSKRVDAGRAFLTSNELHQMAGRAGRRGIDEAGHVVLLQTPFEGAEECCELLFSGLEPLVSQFTASYGMVLNLLAGAKITRKLKEQDEVNALHSGRTLEEARKLVEQSFGNYVGSNVMIAAKEELTKIQHEIGLLSLEVGEDAVDRKCREQLSEAEYDEISNLQEELRAEKRLRTELRRQMELRRMGAWKSLLEDFGKGQLPFMCLQYKDNEAVQHTVPAVYIGNVNSFDAKKIMSLTGAYIGDEDNNDCSLSYYVALGSDNSWYLFTEKWVKVVYKTGFPNVVSADGNLLPRESLIKLLMNEELQWEKLADSEFGPLWSMEGSLETWSWSLNVPVLSNLWEEEEVKHWSEEYEDAVECYKGQRRKVSRLKKKIATTKGFKEFKKVLDITNFNKEKIERLKARSNRLVRRIEQIEPSGWKEFLQISKVIEETRALDINNHVMFPLGETAAAIRGENELWLAMVLRNKILTELKPAQLAAVCGSLVSEGIKIRPWRNNSYIYEPSSIVTDVINHLEEQRSSLMEIQDKYGIKISCGLDSQFCGMVEAWASGLTWREIMMDCAMDEGDLARLLRRTIDLLSQIPKLPDIDPLVQSRASQASAVMDRVPLSELAG